MSQGQITEILPFDHEHPFPGDMRMQRATLVLRDAISAYIRWEGMTVYVLQNTVTYQLVGGILNANWVSLATASSPQAYNLEQVLTTGAVADRPITVSIVYSTSVQLTRLSATNAPCGAFSMTYPADTNSYSYYSMSKGAIVSWNTGIDTFGRYFLGIGGGLNNVGDNTSSSKLFLLDQTGQATFFQGVTAPNGSFTVQLTAPIGAFSTQVTSPLGVFATSVVSSAGTFSNLLTTAQANVALLNATAIEMSGTNYSFADSDSYAVLGIGIGTRAGYLGNIPRQQVLVGAAGTTPPTSGTYRAGDFYIVTRGAIYIMDHLGNWNSFCNCGSTTTAPTSTASSSSSSPSSSSSSSSISSNSSPQT